MRVVGPVRIVRLVRVVGSEDGRSLTARSQEHGSLSVCLETSRGGGCSVCASLAAAHSGERNTNSKRDARECCFDLLGVRERSSDPFPDPR